MVGDDGNVGARQGAANILGRDALLPSHPGRLLRTVGAVLLRTYQGYTGPANHIDRKRAEKLAKLNAGYALILQANRKWFDDLIGDGGLRDVVTHESGMMGVQWVKPEGSPIQPLTSLYTRKRPVEKDVFQALKEITAGWFTFLDEACLHFVP